MSVHDEGEPKSLFSIAYSKPNKRFTANINWEDKDYDYDYDYHAENRKKSFRKEESVKKKVVGSDTCQASPLHLMSD